MSQDDSKIEQLKKKLYSNSDEIAEPHRGRLHPHKMMVNSSWDTPPEESYPKVEYKEYKGLSAKAIKMVMICAGLFLISALAIAGFIFFKGLNSISGNNIDIKMLGPVSSPAGEELSLDVDITNNNSSDIILADLIMTYPPGTREAGDKQTAMVSARLPVGTIKSGQTVRETVKSVLFGQENAKENIKVSLEYRVNGSDTIFVKEKDYPIFIGSSPITLTVDALKEITANQDATFTITLKSNSTSVVKGVLLKADYPFGFQYGNADVQPITGNDTWALGDLAPGDERVITIKGKIIGQDNEERAFRFYAGTESPTDETAIGTIFINNSFTIAVRKPFLGADIALDGHGDSTYVATAGNPVKGEITWQNNLDVPINDVVVEAKLSGDMLDKTTVEGDRGFYRSSDNTIIWDRSTLDELKEIGPGQVGRIQFSFASLAPTEKNSADFRRPIIGLDLTIKGKRLNENNVPEQIQSTVSREIKIASGLNMQTQLVRTTGPFENTGPLPPVAEQESTYTVLVTVNNSFNSVKGAAFTATLPPYVKWLNKISPNDLPFTYNADKREITINIGDVDAGTGYTSAAKQFAFQVSLLPSVSQVGTSPLVLSSPRIAGNDVYTGVVVEDREPSIDTQIVNDPAYKYGQEKVVQ